MILLVDADHVTYRAAASCEPTKLKPFLESKQDAILRADSIMESIMYDLGSHEIETYIAGEGNWRYNIYPEYKANRKHLPKPTWLEDVREHLVINWKAELVNEKEVDDVCGIRLTKEGANSICVSLDKDLLTVPGKHYNFVKKLFIEKSPVGSLQMFYKQLITGDASDNIPAFDGKFRHSVPKFVQKILDPIDSMIKEIDMYNYCCDVYSDIVSWADDWQTVLHRNAKVLWIQKQEGDSWQIPNGPMQENMLLS